jgi:predicted ester cyclase
VTGVVKDAVEEANAALARRWFDEGWSRGDVEVAGEVFAADFVLHGKRVGPGGPRRSVQAIRSAFAPMTVHIDLQVTQGPMVVTHYTARGRHTGPYRGIAPTGRWVTASGVQIWTVVDGKVVEDRNVFDEWTLMDQLDER